MGTNPSVAVYQSYALIAVNTSPSFTAPSGELLVVALADRSETSASLVSEVLGRPAPFPVGPHALAARAGASVLMGFGLYEGGASYRIEFVEFGPAAPAGSRGAALQPAVDRYVALLERYARRFPSNWFNFFPYWQQS